MDWVTKERVGWVKSNPGCNERLSRVCPEAVVRTARKWNKQASDQKDTGCVAARYQTQKDISDTGQGKE